MRGEARIETRGRRGGLAGNGQGGACQGGGGAPSPRAVPGHSLPRGRSASATLRVLPRGREQGRRDSSAAKSWRLSRAGVGRRRRAGRGAPGPSGRRTGPGRRRRRRVGSRAGLRRGAAEPSRRSSQGEEGRRAAAAEGERRHEARGKVRGLSRVVREAWAEAPPRPALQPPRASSAASLPARRPWAHGRRTSAREKGSGREGRRARGVSLPSGNPKNFVKPRGSEVSVGTQKL